MTGGARSAPPGPYTVVVEAPAQRALTTGPPRGLPRDAAFAVAELLTGALAAAPHRAGGPLQGVLEGHYSARRGEYRVIYTIDEEERTVHVVRIAHRRDAYRP